MPYLSKMNIKFKKQKKWKQLKKKMK
jgi:hypothetical protein